MPDVVRARAVAADGGARWLAALPDLVAHLEHAWSIEVGEALGTGTTAFVARARTARGEDAVLKLAVPDPDFVRQVRTLERAGGRGYAHLLASDLERHAVLLEGLGPSLDRSGLAPEAQLAVLSDLLRLAWAVPPGPGAEEPVDKALDLHVLVTRLWDDLDGPCPERVVAAALACAERRSAAFDPDRCVVVHGDAAPPNALRATTARAGTEAGYVFVDPDGFLGDRTYDLGVVLRDWCPQLLAGDAPALARRYCRRLADRSGADPAAVWHWGLLERVSTGLHALRLGEEEMARPLLRTAEVICGEDGAGWAWT